MATTRVDYLPSTKLSQKFRPGQRIDLVKTIYKRMQTCGFEDSETPSMLVQKESSLTLHLA